MTFRLLLWSFLCNGAFGTLLISNVRDDGSYTSINLPSPKGAPADADVDCHYSFNFAGGDTSTLAINCSLAQSVSNAARGNSTLLLTAEDQFQWHVELKSVDIDLSDTECEGTAFAERLPGTFNLCVGIVYDIIISNSSFGSKIFDHTFINTPECLTYFLQNHTSSECQCPYSNVVQQFAPGNLSVNHLDGIDENGSVILSWDLPIPEHLQKCFYCTVTCNYLDSKGQQTDCSYPRYRSVATCDLFTSPYGFNLTQLNSVHVQKPSLVIRGLQEGQTYYFQVHVYSPYPDPRVIAALVNPWPPDGTDSNKFKYTVRQSSSVSIDDETDSSVKHILAISFGSAFGLALVFILALVIFACKCNIKKMVCCHHEIKNKFNVKADGATRVAIGPGATVETGHQNGNHAGPKNEEQSKKDANQANDFDVTMVGCQTVAIGINPEINVQDGGNDGAGYPADEE